MADDAGALLVRSGLVSTSALAEARTRAEAAGGTVGEQLVAGGILADDALTEFYKQRLLVPQVNPNTLARLAPRVIALLPSEMAIELRAVPVSLDAENNLTVAMGDPSNRHAVDEIAFQTGAYVVRAVATQMQIAWCLAHYYGHVTQLGQRLLQGTASAAPRAVAAAVRPGPRKAAVIGIARDTQPVEPVRDASHPETRARDTQPNEPILDDPLPESHTRDTQPREETEDPTKPTKPAKPVRARPRRGGAPTPVPAQPSVEPPASADAPVEPPPIPTPRASSAPGEVRPALPRAASIKPPLPEDDDAPLEIEAIEPSAPVISIEVDAPAEDATPTPPKRKRPAEPDPPELFARAGEVSLRSGPVRAVPLDEPRVVIADDLEPPVESSVEVSGELAVRDADDRPVGGQTKIEISEELVEGPSSGVVIHERPVQASEPVLLDRRRSVATPPRPEAVLRGPAEPERASDGGEEVVELATKKAGVRHEKRRTVLGIGIVPATTRALDEGVPGELDDEPTGNRRIDNDPTRLDTPVAPAGDDSTSDEVLAAPPNPVHDHETGPLAAPPSRQAGTHVPPPSGKVVLDHVRARTPTPDDDDDDAGDTDVPELVGSGAGVRVTRVMSAVELDQIVPERTEDSVDDGWGEPGSTIPPPLLGAIPGGIEPASGMIPLPNLDSEPLIVSPPAAPESTRGSSPVISPVRALEEATARVLDLIRTLERATDRDDVVVAMVEHLAATHQRAGFYAVRAGELSLFMLAPSPTTVSTMTLRLDRPSTLQDVVGTRLPYRGPMHDETSRAFLAATLGSSPPELLLVPISVRERVVGVLFGEQRVRHMFDDQLALAARAAGAALERILKDRRAR